MLFWIFVGIFVVALVGVTVCYYLDCDVGVDITEILTVISGIAIVVSIAIMSNRYIHADADVAKYQKDVDEVVIFDKRGINKGLIGLLNFIMNFQNILLKYHL